MMCSTIRQCLAALFLIYFPRFPLYILHYFLQNYDLSAFDPRRAPVTEALVEEKFANLNPVEQFIYYELIQEKPFSGYRRIETVKMTDRCIDWLTSMHYSVSLNQVRSRLGKLLKKLGVSVNGKSGRDAIYELPDKLDFQK